MSEFSTKLRQFMKRRGITQMSFGAALGYSRNGFISQVLTGRKSPPLDRLHEWAEVLQLSSAETDEFIRLACLECGPDYVRKLVAEIDQCREKLAKNTTTGS